MAAGSTSKEQFGTCVDEFLSISRQLNDTWEHREVRSQVFMCKKSTTLLKGENVEITTEKNPVLLEEDNETTEEADTACLPYKGANSVLTYDYHVVYSESYAVPVLYFNVYKADGRLLSLTDVWSRVPSLYRERLEEERWSFITQQEHPILGRPFFQLHPCHTATLMSNLPSNKIITSGNYLVTWLSSVGPVVGLNLPMEYGKLISAT